MGEFNAAPLSLSCGEQRLSFDPADHSVRLTYRERTVLTGKVGAPSPESPRLAADARSFQLTWPDAQLLVSAVANAFHVEWKTAPGVGVADVYDLSSGGHWFGGGELVRQGYPLESLQWELAPYRVWDNGPTGLGGVLHPVWFTSSGVTVAADPTCEILVGLNAPRAAPAPRPWLMGIDQEPPVALPLPDDGSGDGLLRLKIAPEHEEGGRLAYTLTAHQTLVAAQKAFLRTLPRPRSAPPAAMFRDPIWTTWARFKMGIDQKWTLRFADEIIANRFPHSLMEIDDKWSRAYGDFEFDPIKFPDPVGMVRALHERGFRVTLWVTPFAAADSRAFAEGASKGFWVAGRSGAPELVRWWQGQAYALDVTNDDAVDWFLARLRRLQETHRIDGFKFDAGEPCFLPAEFRTHRKIAPNDYTTLWVERIASQFEWAEVRSAYRNQASPLFVREWDRNSTWGEDNGLRSIVTAALTFGLLGYPFVLPDMVGGNAYGSLLPDRELLIRWTQANALLPAMQFSIAPWDFDNETTDLCRRAVHWHTSNKEILTLAENAVRTGEPIVRPVSWLAPDDPQTYAIGDQFALGDATMIAPVMSPGARERSFYLPAGLWRDVLRRRTLQGGRWIEDYPAPLDYLPWFERVPPDGTG